MFCTQAHTGKTFSSSSVHNPQGHQRSCKEWKVHVYIGRKRVSKQVNCAAEWLHKTCIFLSPSLSLSQTKASCRESFSMLVSGSCGQSVTRAKRVWPAWDGNRDQQRQNKKSSWAISNEYLQRERQRQREWGRLEKRWRDKRRWEKSER